MSSNSLKMIKIDRNMSEIWQILCKNIITLVHFFILLCALFIVVYILSIIVQGRDSPLGTANRLRAWRYGVRIFLFLVMSRQAVRRTQPFQVAKRPGHEFNHSLPSGAEVKKEWSYTPTPPLYLHGMDGGSFTFTFIITQQQKE